jgi:hypothetical protein
MKRILYWLLVVANAIVLLGQLWPDGAPAFAHTVNVATLAADVVVFVLLARAHRAPKKG